MACSKAVVHAQQAVLGRKASKVRIPPRQQLCGARALAIMLPAATAQTLPCWACNCVTHVKDVLITAYIDPVVAGAP